MNFSSKPLAASTFLSKEIPTRDSHFNFLGVTEAGFIECRLVGHLRQPRVRLLIDNTEVAILKGTMIGASLDTALKTTGLISTEVPRVYRDDARHLVTAIDETGAVLGEQAFRMPRVVTGILETCDLSGALRGVVDVSGLTVENLALRLLINADQSIPFLLGPDDLTRNTASGETRFTFRLRLPNDCRTGNPAALSLILEEAERSCILDEKVFRTSPPKQGQHFSRNAVKRLAIIETSLTAPRGHMIAAIEVIIDVARSMGLEPIIIGNKKFEGGAISGVKVETEFSKSIYEISSRPTIDDQLAAFKATRETFSSELSTVLDKFGSTDTLFFYPTVNEYFINSVSDILKAREFSKMEYHLICLMLETGIRQTEYGQAEVIDPVKADLFRDAFKSLGERTPSKQTRKLQDHVHVAAVSETHRANYQLLSPIPIKSMPPLYGYSSKLDTLDHASRESRSGQQVLLYLGEAKENKGFALVPTIAAKLLKNDPTRKLIVQVHNTTTPATQQAVDELQAMNEPNVRILNGFLSRHDYMNLLSTSDAVVMAYDPERYACKTSGVFWEAMSFDLPIIVPDATWLFQEAILADAKMECFSDHSAECVATAIETLLSRIERQPGRPPKSDMLSEVHRFFNETLSGSCASSLTFADIFNPSHIPPQRGDLASREARSKAATIEANDEAAFVSGWSTANQTQYFRQSRWMGMDGLLCINAERNTPLDIEIKGERFDIEVGANTLKVFADGYAVSSIDVTIRNLRDFVVNFTIPPRYEKSAPCPTWIQLSIEKHGDAENEISTKTIEVTSISFAPATTTSFAPTLRSKRLPSSKRGRSAPLHAKPRTVNTDLDDCICVQCGERALNHNSQNEVRCIRCRATYEIFNGMPCLLQYQPSETLSLIEILSNLDEKRTPPTPETYRDWFHMLNKVHSGTPIEDIIKDKSSSLEKFLPHRYRQYSVFKTMSEGIDFKDRKVLDVGAGEGFDTAMIAYEGANVTAAEFNPLLCDLGQGAIDARWIPSSAHALPFEDGTFDVIVCQAALHHFLDVSSAMREFLRVVRTGGFILTVSDSYRVSSTGEDVELRQFNKDPAVLRGVNECMPRLSDFIDPLRKYGDSVDVEIHTSRVHGYPDTNSNKRLDFLEPRVWNLAKHGENLLKTAGGVSFKIRKLKPIKISKPIMNPGIVRPSDFLGGTNDKASALALLARFIPTEYCDMAFPGPVGNTKFELLNGWMAREDDQDWRTGYLRARRFLTRKAAERSVVIEAKLPVQADDQVTTGMITVSVNGAVVNKREITSTGWTTISADASRAPDDAPFSVEIRLLGETADLDSKTFQVRRFETGA